MKSVIGSEEGMKLIMAGENVFISGPGGSGKSMMIKTLREFFGESFLFVGPTGVSALNIRGQSCHKAFGLTFGVSTSEDYKAKSKKAAMLLSSDAIEALVIDETSMLRSDKLYEMDIKLRYHRKKNVPFGGLQVIGFGDGFQIKPVLTRQETPLFREMHGDELPFDCPTWKELNFSYCYLPKVHRQADPEYAMHLNNIRVGNNVAAAVNYLNERCYGKGLLEDAVTLTTTNKLADDINKREFDKLPGSPAVFKAHITGEFPDRPVAEEMALKVGCKVMIVVNDPDPMKKGTKYVNGTVGFVTRVAATYISIDVDGEEIHLGKSEWKNTIQVPEEVFVDKEEEVQNADGTTSIVRKKVKETRLKDKEIGTFTQFPVKFGWAITGHKAQGLTLDKVNIDLGNGAFTAGQTYVMLSRARDTSGLRLAQPLRTRDIIVDYKVLKFYREKFPEFFGGSA